MYNKSLIRDVLSQMRCRLSKWEVIFIPCLRFMLTWVIQLNLVITVIISSHINQMSSRWFRREWFSFNVRHIGVLIGKRACWVPSCLETVKSSSSCRVDGWCQWMNGASSKTGRNWWAPRLTIFSSMFFLHSHSPLLDGLGCLIIEYGFLHVWPHLHMHTN